MIPICILQLILWALFSARMSGTPEPHPEAANEAVKRLASAPKTLRQVGISIPCSYRIITVWASFQSPDISVYFRFSILSSFKSSLTLSVVG